MVHAARLRAVAAPAADMTVLSLLRLSAEASKSKIHVAQDDRSPTLSLPGSTFRGCHACSLDGVVKGILKAVRFDSDGCLREECYPLFMRADGGTE